MSMSDTPTPTPNDGSNRASNALGDLRQRVGSASSGFNQSQKVRMVMVFVGVAGAVLAYSFLSTQTTWAPLMSQLSPEDAAVVTEALAAKGIEFQLADGGSTVQVAQDAVYQARVDIAEVQMPSSGKIGYGILDNQSLTTSEFGQRVGFQRAMEGEMAKTIEAIDGVELATVHLALPRSDAFVLDDQEASASVMVTTGKEVTLRSKQVQAIVNLVASGVEGLTAARVTVADNKGNVLAAPGGVTASGSGDDATEMYESSVSNSIEDMLAAAVGPGHSRVTVAAELDYDAKSVVTESFTAPEPVTAGTPLAATEVTKTETYNGAGGANGNAGQLGPDGTPIGGDAAAAGTDYNLNERNVTNALNKVTETTNEAPGKVQRMSVAVVLDENKVTDAALIPEIEGLVAAAAGIDPTRGDIVAVTRLPFDEQVSKALEADLKEKAAIETGLPIWVYGAGGVALLAVIGLLIVLRKAKKSRPEVIEALALPAGDSDRLVTLNATPRAAGNRTGTLVGAGVGSAGLGAGRGGGLSTAEPSAERREVLGELIDNQPDEVAQLLRSWLGDRREVTR